MKDDVVTLFFHVILDFLSGRLGEPAVDILLELRQLEIHVC